MSKELRQDHRDSIFLSNHDKVKYSAWPLAPLKNDSTMAIHLAALPKNSWNYARKNRHWFDSNDGFPPSNKINTDSVVSDIDHGHFQ
jgi:hypothetical protein